MLTVFKITEYALATGLLSVKGPLLLKRFRLLASSEVYNQQEIRGKRCRTCWD